MKVKYLALAGALACVSSIASAQSFNSFAVVEAFNQISLNGAGNNMTATLGLNPSFTLGGVTYQITDVFGAWFIDKANDLDATGADTGVWNFHKNLSGTGGIVGWKTNPNTGLTPGQSKSFTFSTISGSTDDTGFHVRSNVTLPGGGNTMFIRGGAVPEPTSIAAVFAGIGMLRARRARK